MTDDIVVTQADRDAAADFSRDQLGGVHVTLAQRVHLREGKRDGHSLVQLLACHRQAEQERCAGIVEAAKVRPHIAELAPSFASSVNDAFDNIAAAIREGGTP